MNKEKIKSILHYIVLSALSGIFTGLLIFAFKLAASYIIRASVFIYELARENIVFIPVFFIGIVLISIAIHGILKFQPDCRGGGIPTTIAYIRGKLSFNWVKTVLVLPFSALLTFFSGIPLGNEGPSVQLGCAAGKGMVSLLKKEDRESEKYIITASASAGFAAATGAPLSALVFAFEELYRSFSAVLLMASAIAVGCSAAINNLLSMLFHIETKLFSFSLNNAMPLKYIWCAVLIGVVAGFAVMLSAFSERIAKNLLRRMNNISMLVKVIAVSLIAAVFGLCSGMFIGSGHDLIENIFENGNISILLLATVLIVRAVLLMAAGGIGITGGKFLPTLAIGAILGELSARLCIYIGLIDGEHRTVLMLLGVAAFLAARSKIPVVALCFSVEALCGFSNIAHFAVSIGISCLVVKLFKVKDFSETVIEKNKVKNKELCDTEVGL